MDGFTPLLKKILLANGCYFTRHGKGDHEIWHSPISERSFPVDQHIKSRHTANAFRRLPLQGQSRPQAGGVPSETPATANAVLKQAGLPKQF